MWLMWRWINDQIHFFYISIVHEWTFLNIWTYSLKYFLKMVKRKRKWNADKTYCGIILYQIKIKTCFPRFLENKIKLHDEYCNPSFICVFVVTYSAYSVCETTHTWKSSLCCKKNTQNKSLTPPKTHFVPLFLVFMAAKKIRSWEG